MKKIVKIVKSEYQLAENCHRLILSFDDDEILCFQPQKDTTLPYVKEFNSQLVLICRYLQEKY